MHAHCHIVRVWIQVQALLVIEDITLNIVISFLTISVVVIIWIIFIPLISWGKCLLLLSTTSFVILRGGTSINIISVFVYIYALFILIIILSNIIILLLFTRLYLMGWVLLDFIIFTQWLIAFLTRNYSLFCFLCLLSLLFFELFLLFNIVVIHWQLYLIRIELRLMAWVHLIFIRTISSCKYRLHFIPTSSVTTTIGSTDAFTAIRSTTTTETTACTSAIIVLIWV